MATIQLPFNGNEEMGITVKIIDNFIIANNEMIKFANFSNLKIAIQELPPWGSTIFVTFKIFLFSIDI